MAIQTAIVLAVAVIPDFLLSAASLLRDYSHRPAPSLVHGTIYIVIRSTIVSAVTLGMILWAPEAWSVFGFKAPRWRDLLWTIAGVLGSWIVSYAAVIVAWLAIAAVTIISTYHVPAQSSYHFPLLRGRWDLLFLAVMSLFNGFAEELVMRAFLLPRIEKLINSTSGALLITSALFASYHAYQGLYGLAGVFGAGLTLGLIFIKTRSIWPIFLTHAAMDALAFLLYTRPG